jgi:hypothetical protein
MSPENNPEFAFGPRSSPDLVASGELLNTLMLGLEHLRRRLQTAQQNQAAEAALNRLDNQRPNSMASKALDIESEPPVSSPKYWYYAEEAEPAVTYSR